MKPALHAPSDRSRCRPFRILDGESEEGPRFGGRAPVGVGTGVLRDEAVYVLTIPLAVSPVLDLSVFVQGELWEAMNGGLFSDDRIVAIAHPPSPRRTDRDHASPLSEHRIVVGEEISDVPPEGDTGTVRADHKLGGRAYCIQEPELDGADALLDIGFVQLVQLDFPSSQDGDIVGSWPFADGMFNLFGGASKDRFMWAFQK